MSKVAVTFSPEVGGSSVISLIDSFAHVESEVITANYRKMMEEIPKEEFDKLYSLPKGRQILFAHAKAKALELLQDVDVLALSGNNAMIDPELFHQTRTPNQTYDLSRTIAELALLHVATEKGMPIFGVCGGHQVIAVYGGGEISDLRSEKLDKQLFMNYDAVKLMTDSLLAQIVVGKHSEEPNITPYGVEFFGAHNQAVSKLGYGFKLSGIASDNESIEAAESEFGVPIITTQFHPEVGAKGLPNANFLYQRTQEEQEMNLDIFRFLDKAGDAYSQKKTMLEELRQLKPKISAQDGIKPVQNNNSLNLKVNGVHQKKKSLPKEEQQVQAPGLLLRIVATIASAFRSIKEGIRNFFGKIFRDRVSNMLTRERVERLREQEQLSSGGFRDGVDVIPASSFNGVLEAIKKEAPSEILRENPAQLWTASKDTSGPSSVDEEENQTTFPTPTMPEVSSPIL